MSIDKNTENTDLDGKPVSLDTKDKQTYTMQASKRSHCQRLTRWNIIMKMSFCYTPLHLASSVFVTML